MSWLGDSYQQSLLAGIHGGDPRLAHLAQYGDNANFYGGELGNSLFQNRIGGFTSPVDLGVLGSHTGAEILSEYQNWAGAYGQDQYNQDQYYYSPEQTALRQKATESGAYQFGDPQAPSGMSAQQYTDQQYNKYLGELPGTLDPNKSYLTLDMGGGNFVPATQGGSLHELTGGYSPNLAGKQQIREGELDNALNRLQDMYGPNADWSKLIGYDPSIGLYTQQGGIQHVNDAGMNVVQQRIVPAMQAVAGALTGNAVGDFFNTVGTAGTAASTGTTAAGETAATSSTGSTLGSAVAKGIGSNIVSSFMQGGAGAAAIKAGGGKMAGQGYGSTMGGTVYDPFESFRHFYGDRLQGMMTGQEQFSGDPSYQFRFNEGQRALESGLAQRGLLGSGAEQLALQQYGQQAASQEWGNQFSRLATLSGANALMGSGLGQMNLQRQMNNMQGVGGILGSLMQSGALSGAGNWISSLFGGENFGFSQSPVLTGADTGWSGAFSGGSSASTDMLSSGGDYSTSIFDWLGGRG